MKEWLIRSVLCILFKKQEICLRIPDNHFCLVEISIMRDINPGLLVRYVSNEASLEEIAEVETWMKQNDVDPSEFKAQSAESLNFQFLLSSFYTE